MNNFKLLTVFFTAITIIFVGGVYLATRPEKTYSKNQLVLENTAVLGTSDAKVTLIEFSDFQCPACKAYKPVVDELVDKHGDRILFAYRHFPLPQHTLAKQEAIASEATGEQGKFWEMYDYLFENQSGITEELINDGAKEIGLDLKKYEEDKTSDYLKVKVEKDMLDGKRLGVNSTPTFFLNGKKLNAKSPADLIRLVEQAINEQ